MVIFSVHFMYVVHSFVLLECTSHTCVSCLCVGVWVGVSVCLCVFVCGLVCVPVHVCEGGRRGHVVAIYAIFIS